MLRTVFMGTPSFAATILQKLVDSGIPPVAVICQPARETGRGRKTIPCEVEEKAKALNLPVIATENINAPEIVEKLAGFDADLFLVAAFGQLLKKSVLELPKRYCLNVHGSLLPKYRGAAPIQRAVIDGETQTGIAIQKMVRKLDAGDLLIVKATPIKDSEDAADLFERLALLGGECLVEAVRLVESGKEVFTPQEEALATLAPKLTKEEAVLDWNLPGQVLLNRIRGLQPWPIAESKLGGVRLKIFKASLTPGGQTPGTIQTDHKTQLVVACGNATALALTQIQLENRKKLETRDFLMAYRGNFPFSTMG